MVSLRFLPLLLSFGLVFSLASPVHAATPPKKKSEKAQKTAGAGAYRGAILMDAATGNVLFEDDADVENPPASVTKLMTFAVVHDRIRAGDLSLQAPVSIVAQDCGMGGTQVYLKEKEVFSVEELIYAMMVQSANDAAHALSRVAGGSRAAFVELMNAKAAELGMTKTKFQSPHGLPPSSGKSVPHDMSSPRDIALLSRHLLQSTDVLRYSAIERRPFGAEVRREAFMMDNHNNLLGKVSGVDGLKTGFTRAAGYCIAATAERNGRRVIAVVMGSAEAKTRDLATGNLIEKGFAALPLKSTPVSPVSPVTAPGLKSTPTRPSAGGPVTPSAPKIEEAQPQPIRYPDNPKPKRR